MDNELLKFVGCALVSVLFLFWGLNQLQGASCHATTAGMKVTVDYSFLGGCRVSTPDGRMVPLEAYREFKQQH